VRRLGALMAFAVLLSAAGFARADGGLCQAGVPRVTSARATLAATPASLPARFELADALIEANCYHDAVHTLEDAKSIHPRSAELAAKLRNAQSLLSEQDYFEGKEQAELAAKLSRNLLRCTRLGDIDACDEALKIRPDDAQIWLAKGDALLKAARPGEAEAAFRSARQIAPNDARMAAQLAVARAQRQPLLEQCRKVNDDAALQACQGALSKGAEDEREILARIASLRQPRSPVVAAAAPRVVQAQTPVAADDAHAPPPVPAPRRYSNAAEPGRSR
jgi:tetratricopeptide (TPR) repeat protein